MLDTKLEIFPPSKFKIIRDKWSLPDKYRGRSWDIDGLPGNAKKLFSYDNEMQQGLDLFNCHTFDELVVTIGQKLGRKPNVIDLMGGAYFLSAPENTTTLTGIRIHDKDQDFYNGYQQSDSNRFDQFRQIVNSPNRKIIEADILSNKGWQKIKLAKLAPADLLVCRPMGPFDIWKTLVDDNDDPIIYGGLFSSLFQRMLTLVDHETGIVFTEIPDMFTDKSIAHFFAEVDHDLNCQTTLFTAPEDAYKLRNVTRRYVVSEFC